ncbi:MAG TPA: lipid II flippase MurJ, partial [Solirubrobacterales bacterium]|nr:lipid II flippase MurJ [Solirubrobacterales bacterium]
STELVSEALFWFAFSLPFSGVFLLQTRTFFSLQRPWVPTAISVVNLIVTAGVSLLLYEPYGIGGIVAATGIANVAAVIAGGWVLRGQLGRLELGQLLWSGSRILLSAGALAAVSYFTWDALDSALGRDLAAQIASVGIALVAGAVVYGVALTLLRVPEMGQVLGLFRRRSA